MNSKDTEVLTNACWGLSCITDGGNDRIDSILRILPALPDRLVALLRHPSRQIYTPALRTAGNIVTGSNGSTQQMIEAGMLDALVPLLTCTQREVRKEVAWASSNVASGTSMQIQSMLDIPELIHGLASYINNNDMDLAKEAVCTFSNMSTNTTPEQLDKLFQMEPFLLQIMIQYGISVPDYRMRQVIYEFVNNVFDSGRKATESHPNDPYFVFWTGYMKYANVQALISLDASTCERYRFAAADWDDIEAIAPPLGNYERQFSSVFNENEQRESGGDIFEENDPDADEGDGGDDDDDSNGGSEPDVDDGGDDDSNGESEPDVDDDGDESGPDVDSERESEPEVHDEESIFGEKGEYHNYL